jgi:hypothetical protein
MGRNINDKSMSVTVFIWFDPAPIDRDRPAGKSQSTGGFDLSEMNGFVFLLVIWQSNGKVEQFMWPSCVTHYYENLQSSYRVGSLPGLTRGHLLPRTDFG